MTAEAIARGLDGRRCGRGYRAYCPVHEGKSRSFSIDERDGRPVFCCRAGCAQRDVIEALRARGLWPEKAQHSPAERADWARQQREIERVLPEARYWRRAAVNLTEEMLVTLKAALFDPTLPRPGIGEIRHVEAMLTRLRVIDSASLAAEYTSWSMSHPGITAGLVRAGRERERAERVALSTYLRSL